MNPILKLVFSLVFFLCVFEGQAQSILITGKTVDKEGAPLPGVSIVVKGSSNGTSSSFDGDYALTVNSKEDILQFSYLGFDTKELAVANNTVINMVLTESQESLEEVQIVAFQKQKKSSVIASINTIKPSELKQPSSNLTAALAGRLAGVISYQRSGEPGQDNAEFFIRGVTSFGYKNSPLIMIDGLEVTSNDLARIDPENINSFSIMKDATATALYGARGANGVILVTTKEGKKGKPKISVRIENSFSAPTKINQFLGAVDYMELYNSALRTRDNNALLLYSKNKIEGTRNGLDSNIYPNVDWYSEMFRDYIMNKRINLNVSGGGDIAQYYLSITQSNEKGLLEVDALNNFNNNIDINRSNLRANININLSKTTTAKVKFYSLYERYNGPVDDADALFEGVVNANPANFPKYYDFEDANQFYNHTLFGNKGNGGFSNPYADMVKGYKDRFRSTILSQFQLEQDLSFVTEGLKVRAMASVKSYSSNENTRSFTPFYYGVYEAETEEGVSNLLYQIQEGTEYLNNPQVSNEANSNFYFEFVTQYSRTFNKKHDVGALVVFNRTEKLNTIGGGNSAYTTLPSRNLGLSGRFTYAYDDRYFSEFNFGFNGTEKFAKNNRFGFFPSAGFGWNVSNESFFEKIKPVVSLLRLKYTYGIVGNDAISGPEDRFFYLSDVNISDGGKGYTFGEQFNNYYPGYYISRYPNPEVSWEIAKKANYGLELGLFKKATLQVDYFTEERSNIYMSRDYVPETFGSTATIKSNVGEVHSHGIDISLDSNFSFVNGFWLTTRGNFTYATNEIIKNGEPVYPYDYLSKKGYSVNQEWGYLAERLFIDQADIDASPSQFNQGNNSELGYLAGDIKYTDVNKDGKVDELDRVPIGQPTIPEIVYGFGASMGYKNFDMSFFFQGVAKQSFFIDPNKIAPFVDQGNALSVIANNHWSDKNPDPNAFWPRLSTSPVTNNEERSTWWLRDADFLRLKSLEIGYSLPENLMKKAHLQSTRIYLSGLNLFALSKFKLWDPEMGDNGLGYPTQRVVNLGLQIKL